MFPEDNQPLSSPHHQPHPQPLPVENQPQVPIVPTPGLSNTDMGFGSATTGLQPVPVVKVLSTRGVEFAMMTIAMWVVAGTIGWIILSLVNGSNSYNDLVVPMSALITGLPIFAFLFLRSRKAELADPSLKMEPSKRRWTQLSQMLAFVICFSNIGFFVYAILQHFGSGSAPSIGKELINLVVVLAIAGGILTFYWADEHKVKR